MRRIAMLLGVAMVMLVVAAGVAVAIDKTCENVPCRGTNNDDDLSERKGKDRILGLDGDDLLDANNFGSDRDRLQGGPQSDRLLANDNDTRDGVDGDRGNDRCIVDAGDNTRSCSVSTQAAGVHPAGFETD